MDEEALKKEIESYIERISSYQKDIFRLEGIIIYLKNKMEQLKKKV